MHTCAVETVSWYKSPKYAKSLVAIHSLTLAALCILPAVVTDQPETHVKRIAEFSIDAIAAANTTPIDLENPALGFVDIRVGFHSGPVVA